MVNSMDLVERSFVRLYLTFLHRLADPVAETGSKYNLENAASAVHMINSIREA